MKVMISQPMNGLTPQEIEAKRNELIDLINVVYKKPTIIDSYFGTDFNNFSIKSKPVYYLAKSIEQLSMADVLVLADGWSDARGCRIENIIAQEYGIQTITEFDLRNRI